MAKRKAAPRRRATAGTKRAAAPKRRATAPRGAARKATARKTTKKSARPAAKRAAKKAAPKVAKKSSAARIVRRVAKKMAKPAAKAPARKAAPAAKLVKKPRVAPTRPTPAPARVAAKPKAAIAPAASGKKKHALGLDRERRIVQDDDDIVSSTPPSSLNLDRSASSARSGRQELKERYDKHNETSPALTGGDVDADWESAYSVGDEAPGGDNPTPDQNNVDDIGVALGVEYEDNEELEGAEKIEERDRHRWEDDPASSEDFEDR
jgi:hypothetical protein